MRRATALVFLLLGCQATAEPAGMRDARRVVSLHDVTTEIVIALGARDRLVGVTDAVDTPREVEQAVANVPRVGELESILARKPDCVLGTAVVRRRDPELVQRLREAGVRVLLVEPHTLQDVYAQTRSIADLLGLQDAGERVVSALVKRERRLREAAVTGRRVFVFDCCDPPFTAGGRSVLSDLIARAGGQNIFADLATDWSSVSWEAAIARKPELIVVHAYRYEGQGDVEAKRRTLAAIPALASLPVVVMPLGLSLGGLRSLDGLERLRAAMGAGS